MIERDTMENAVRGVRQPHLDALRNLGVSTRAIAHLGQYQPPFGVLNGTVDCDGLFVPGDGPARVVQPVISGRQIVDLVAWRTARPDSWHLTTGLGWLMGEDQIYPAPGVPVPLHATPLQWLASGGQGICILDWNASELPSLRSLDAIEVAEPAIGKMLLERLSQPQRLPRIMTRKAVRDDQAA